MATSWASRGDLNQVDSIGDRKVILTGRVVMTTGGTISTTTLPDCDGFTIVKTASEAGRYTLTLTAPGLIEYAHAVVELGTDAAAVQAKGVACTVRNVDPAARDTLDIQFTIVPTAAAAGADAELQDSAIIRIVIVVNRGKS